MSKRWIPWFASLCVISACAMIPATVTAHEGADETASKSERGEASASDDTFADLYPDVDLPAAAPDVGDSAAPATAGPSSVGPPDESPDTADASGAQIEPSDAADSPSLDLSDLYPDVELPGATELVGPETAVPGGGREETEPPDGGDSPPADASQPPAAGDPFGDLYPDRELPGGPGAGEQVDLSPPGDQRGEMESPDAALIDELLGNAERRDEEDEAVMLQRPRDLLALFDPPIDESQLRSFVDGQPLGGADEETLTRILYRLPRFSLVHIDSWENLDPDWSQLVEAPDVFRAEFFRVRGRVQRIERVGVIPEIADLLQFEHYYRVHLTLPDESYRAIVCTRNIPNAWIRAQNEDRELDERAGCSGLFLKVGGEEDGARKLIFAARRVAWFPDRENEALGVTPELVLLGNRRMDVGLFELVKDRSSIGPTDREGFYQLLSALGHTKLSDLDALAAPTHDIEAMLTKPQTQRGRLFSIRGNARRIIKIRVDDPDIRERFGITHYYELAVFVPLKHRIEIKVADDEPPKRFDNTYPMIFCVRQLPQGMPSGSDIREPVTVQIPAYFFKLYSYRSQFMSAGTRGAHQYSPLLVGLEPEWILPKQQSNPWLSILLGGLFIVAVAGIWFGLWRYSQSDRAFERETLARQFELADGKSLNDMGLEASSGPDFSGLESASTGPESGSDGRETPVDT